MLMLRLLPWLTLVSGLLAVSALHCQSLPLALGWVAKPLTTVLILLFIWPRGRETPALAGWLRLGMVCALAGDVCMLWPEVGWVPGLVCFSLAHLAYLRGFCVTNGLARPMWPLLLFVGLAALVLRRLWGGIAPEYQWLVLLYVLCLALVAGQAWVWWRHALGTPDEAFARSAAWGGTLLVLSEALMAIVHMAGPMPSVALWILPSYWVAQWCFAASLRPPAYMPLNNCV